VFIGFEMVIIGFEMVKAGHASAGYIFGNLTLRREFTFGLSRWTTLFANSGCRTAPRADFGRR